jgi:hypothetical protein
MAGRYARDPISVQFDAAALRLLRRAHANRGDWVGTYLQNPGADWQLWAVRNGWGRLLGPDDAPGGEARTRWARAFIRSCYYNHKSFMYLDGLRMAEKRPRGVRPPLALDYQVGTVRLSERPNVVVIGRAVRVRLLTGGQAAAAAAAKVPDSKRWIVDRQPGPRHAGWTYQG